MAIKIEFENDQFYVRFINNKGELIKTINGSKIITTIIKVGIALIALLKEAKK